MKRAQRGSLTWVLFESMKNSCDAYVSRLLREGLGQKTREIRVRANVLETAKWVSLLVADT